MDLNTGTILLHFNLLAANPQVPGSIPDATTFWALVDLERGPLSPCESKWGATWKESRYNSLVD
jgi:hypothetical protein